MKTVLVCGSRDWRQPYPIVAALSLLKDMGFDTLIHGAQESRDPQTGEAYGADFLAGQAGWALKFRVISFPADWQRFDRRAGPIRNRQMLREGKPDLVVYFHTDLDSSKGTRDMVRAAKHAGVTVEDGLVLATKWCPF